MVSSALACTGLTAYSSHGVANIMCKKLAAHERLWRGYTFGWPMAVLYASAAIVGICERQGGEDGRATTAEVRDGSGGA